VNYCAAARTRASYELARVVLSSRIDLVKSRAHAIKRATTGLGVRCFNVVTKTGHGRAGRSTGSTLSDKKRATERGI